MINLDQVRTLEWKVKQAVQLITHLRRENDTLRGRLADTEVRFQELESLLESFKATQNEMESGIRNALEDLDHLETVELNPPPLEVREVTPVAEAFALGNEPAYKPGSEQIADPIEVEAEVPSEEVPDSPSFEEEFAALAAEEEAARESSQPVPESVELEPEADFEAEADSEKHAEDDREPEQPGLGIF